MRQVLYNAKVILFDRILYGGGIEVEDGYIKRVFTGGDFDKSLKAVDCDGLYLAPGFIDIHVHGGGGCDFSDGTTESVKTVIATHAEHGTTSLLATTLSKSVSDVIRALTAIEKVQNDYKFGPKILGSHMEGNFFSMAQKGAQDPKYIFPPIKENYEPIVSSVQNIKMISCAPEIENACGFAEAMKKKGVVMSVAHSDATYHEFVNGVEHGFNHITHIYNGNSFLHNPYFYCQIGASEASLLLDNVFVEVIPDGRHLPVELLRLIYKIKGADNINLCTDAMSAAGMPEGNYKLGELDVLVEDGVAMLPDKTSFAGSVCTSDRAVRTMYREVGVPLVDAVKMITATPARILNVFNELGSISEGKRADVNLFDEDIDIKYTLINGEVFNNNL